MTGINHQAQVRHNSGYENRSLLFVPNDYGIRKYYFTFDGSKYVTWKINSYEIALQEITLIA